MVLSLYMSARSVRLAITAALAALGCSEAFESGGAGGSGGRSSATSGEASTASAMASTGAGGSSASSSSSSASGAAGGMPNCATCEDLGSCGPIVNECGEMLDCACSPSELCVQGQCKPLSWHCNCGASTSEAGACCDDASRCAVKCPDQSNECASYEGIPCDAMGTFKYFTTGVLEPRCGASATAYSCIAWRCDCIL